MSKNVTSSKATKNSKNSKDVVKQSKKVLNPQYNDEGEYEGKDYQMIDSLAAFLTAVCKREQTSEIDLIAGATQHINAADDGSSEEFTSEGAAIVKDDKAIFFLTYSSQVSDEDPDSDEILNNIDDYAVYQRVEASASGRQILILGKQTQSDDIVLSDDRATFRI